MYNMIYSTDGIEILQTDEFAKWLGRLNDPEARARINIRIRRISLTGNFGDVKPVGDGVNEIRIDYGPGYRVYYAQRGSRTILLLCGGVKATQRADIAKSKRINSIYE